MTTGRCLCGAIRYEYAGEADAGHALPLRELPPPDILADDDLHHRAEDGVAVHPGQPKEFASSPGVARSFCGECGSPIYYRAEDRPERHRPVRLHAG